MDSEAILNYVMKSEDINNKELYIFGRSLGGAVAIHLAAKLSEKVWWTGLSLRLCNATYVPKHIYHSHHQFVCDHDQSSFVGIWNTTLSVPYAKNSSNWQHGLRLVFVNIQFDLWIH